MTRRRSSTSISAMRPVFPDYLLSSFNFVFHRRKSASSASFESCFGGVTSPPPSSSITPAISPSQQIFIGKQGSSKKLFSPRLSRTAPDILRCSTCSTDIASAAQIISKGFTGRYGRALLVASPSPAEQSLLNIRIGRSEDRQLVTGWHIVADICCATCSRKLGWKYVDAKEQSQKYKVGKFILETERVMTHRSWEDFAINGLDINEGASDDCGSRVRSKGSNQIVFDSDDDEECEDIFAGTWDAATVAKRRSQSLARRITLTK